MFLIRLSDTSLSLKVWIAFNHYIDIETQNFDFEFGLPATKGDTPLSATEKECSPYQEQNICKGDSLGIHLKRSDLQKCRRSSKCVIFLAVQIDTIERTEITSKTNITIAASSCLRWVLANPNSTSCHPADFIDLKSVSIISYRL